LTLKELYSHSKEPQTWEGEVRREKEKASGLTGIIGCGKRDVRSSTNIKGPDG